MICKVSLLLFLCALYCADGKTLVQKPQELNSVEQNSQQDDQRLEDLYELDSGINEDDKGNLIMDENEKRSTDLFQYDVEEELSPSDNSANEEIDTQRKNDENEYDIETKLQPLVKSSRFNFPQEKIFEPFPATELKALSQKVWQQNYPKWRSLKSGNFADDDDQQQNNLFENLNSITGEQLKIDETMNNMEEINPAFPMDKLESSSNYEEFDKNEFLARVAKHPGFGTVKKSQKKNTKVGFVPNFFAPKLKVASLTQYVAKAIAASKSRLEPRISAQNPPLVIEAIPGVTIILNLKYVEGFDTLMQSGDSKGFYSNKLYAFTQGKFDDLRFFYDVKVNFLGLYTVDDKININLNNAPAKLQFSLDKDMQANLLHFEYVNPTVRINYKGNFMANMGLNYLMNNVHPVVKQKIVEIVSRDTKMLIQAFLSKTE